MDQRHIIEGRDLLALFGADVGVDQVAHGRLIHLEVNVVAARQLHLVPDLLEVVNLGLQRLDLGPGVTGLSQLVGDVGKRADEGGHVLVQREAVRFVLLQLLGVP